jgi:hypothetical protein
MKNDITIEDHSNEGHTRTDKYEGQRCGSYFDIITLIFEVMMITATTANVAVADHYDDDVHDD